MQTYSTRRVRASGAALLIAGLIWTTGISFGLSRLWDYSFKVNGPCRAPSHWSPESIIPLDGARATLIMFLHPQCPCSRASVEELARLMRFSAGRLSAHVCVFTPSGFPDDWEQTDIRNEAAAIPGVQLHRDLDAIEARRFRATTSGAVVLYGSKGELLFSGGITNSRGHAGDSVGTAEILAILDGRNVPAHETPTFGCPIVDDEQQAKCCSRHEGSGL